MFKEPQHKRIIFSGLWLVFTLAFGAWWFYLGLKQARMVAELKSSIGGKIAADSMVELTRFDRMLKWEGVSFLLLLGLGGATLLYLSWKDMQNTHLMNDFFSTVSHELKTPLASLRLQVESLVEDLHDSKHAKLLDRLSRDHLRLESQMEKALYLANITRSNLVYLEKISLDEIIDSLRQDWKEIQYNHTNLYLKADRKALEGIIKNLIENSINHGKANKVWIRAAKDLDFIQITVKDNGIGFDGVADKLGKPFIRHSITSGTGLGIYLVKNLLGRMNSSFAISSYKNGFEVILKIPSWSDSA